MNMIQAPPTLRHNPLRVFVAILAVLFFLETGVMFLLPEIVPSRIRWVEAIVDALFLILVLAPLLWLWVVKPLNRLAQTRTFVLEQTIRAQEDERRRLARDLHDEIGQLLTSMLVGLRTLEETSAVTQTRDQAHTMRQIAGSIHDEVRRLARGLRPGVLDDLGLKPALERLVEDFRQAHKIHIDLHMEEENTRRLPAALETALYRIVQEALNNVAKHAQARNVNVRVTRNTAAVELSIADDGCGFEPDEVRRLGKSFGLSSMRERAALLEGALRLQSQRGRGTTIRVRLPLAGETP